MIGLPWNNYSRYCKLAGKQGDQALIVANDQHLPTEIHIFDTHEEAFIHAQATSVKPMYDD